MLCREENRGCVYIRRNLETNRGRGGEEVEFDHLSPLVIYEEPGIGDNRGEPSDG